MSRSEPHTVVTYRATGTRRDSRWRRGAPVETYHEGRECASVEQAERSARTLHRLYGGAWEIFQRRRTPGQTDQYTVVATVRGDALGRVWTDCASFPGQPAIL